MALISGIARRAGFLAGLSSGIVVFNLRCLQVRVEGGKTASWRLLPIGHETPGA
jgi:hypothetical protein